MRISTHCPRCGRIELASGDLRLVTVPVRPDLREPVTAEDAWYVYDCTGCAHRVVVVVPPSVVDALATVGVSVWTVPAEVVERAATAREPLTVDDVLDAILRLDAVTAADAS